MRELSPFVLQPTPTPVHEVPPGFHEPIVEEDTHLRDYWRIVRKHLWLISACVASVVVVTFAVVFMMTPQYTAESTVLIERRAPQAIKFEGVQSENIGPDEYDYYKTQYELLRSRVLAARVIRKHDLEQRSLFAAPEKDSDFLASLWSAVNFWGTEETPAPAAEEEALVANPQAVAAYLERLEIKPFPRTRLVKVIFSSPDPQLSAKLVNAHTAAYTEYGVELRTQATVEAQQFLEEKLVELKQRVEKSEAALNDYRREKGILSLDEKENIVVDRLSDLNRRLTEAEAERIGLEAQVRLVRKRDYNSLPAVLDNSLIQTLKEQLATSEAEHAQLLTRFKADYPKVVQMKAQIDELKQRLNSEITKVVAGVESAYLTAENKEGSLREKMEEQKAATLGLKDASVTYAILAREVDTNRQLYDSVLQRMKEMGVAAELRSSNVSIVDKADPPRYPARPRKSLALALSMFVGLLGGVGAAFFREYLDNTVKSPDDVQRHLGLPSLGVVPDFASLAQDTHHLPKIAHVPAEDQDEEVGEQPEPESARALVAPRKSELISSHHPLSVISEAYRTLRTAIFLSRAGEQPKTLLFTSATEGEGKTLTAVNTAVIFAQMGLRVLIIDSDLRRPRCHKVLGVRNWAGLTEVLTGTRTPQEVIKSTATANLFLLSSGAVPPNPAELIGSRRMSELLTTFLQEYDCIVVDSPPVMPVSDAVLLSTLVDGVVLVVNGQKTPRHLVKETRSRLLYARAKILGVVLNRVDMQKSDYAYYYGHYSSYYHQTDEKMSA